MAADQLYRAESVTLYTISTSPLAGAILDAMQVRRRSHRVTLDDETA